MQQRAHPHRFCKEKSLDQIKTELAGGQKISLSLNPDRNRASAESIGDFDDVLAQAPFGAIIRAAGN